MTIMRRFEELIGWIRLSTIYFLSGIAGYLVWKIIITNIFNADYFKFLTIFRQVRYLSPTWYANARPIFVSINKN